MGRAKDEMMRQQELLEEATRIAVHAGVLGSCEIHEGFVWELGGDHTDAYKLGNALYTKQTLATPCKSRKELTDAIKEAIGQAGMGGCPLCAKMLED